MVSIQYTLILFSCLTTISFAACAAAPVAKSEGQVQSQCTGECETPSTKNLSDVKSTAHNLIEAACENKKAIIGVASVYGKGDGLNGKKTASGEILDAVNFTVAHRKLPFGALVRITSLTTKKSVVARVNDRGPFHKGRMVDLNYAAAKAIGLDTEHVGKVEMQICNETN